MLEMTGSSSKIEGLIQVLTRSRGYTILEISRTGRMAMRRGEHTSRVLAALGSKSQQLETATGYSSKLEADEILPNEFENVHEEEI